ncbi:MAG: hypothetical protein PHE24_03750, partial [Patescibacteria group bacterium]|nr:hypothetical protein [Patescibacteria group bacterium]
MNVATKFRSKLLSCKLIFVFVAAIVIGGFFIFTSPVNAETDWQNTLVATDNFDSGIGCTVGANPAMSNCDGWFWNSSCNVPFGQIKNDLSASSPNSLYFNGWGGSGCFLRQPYDTPVFPDKGHITWQVYPKYVGSTWHQSLSVVEEYDPSSVYRINIDGKNVVRLQAIRDNGLYYDVNLIVGALNDSSWNTISFYWDRSGEAIRADLNGLTGSWQNVLYPMPALNSVRIQDSGNQYLQDPILHFDDIQYFQDSPPAVIISGLGQFESDRTTPIAEGASTTDSSITIRGMLSSPVNYPVQLQVEVQPSGIPFTGNPNATSSFFASGQIVLITVSNLPNGRYHWQARGANLQGVVSAWKAMNNPAASLDFTIDSTTGETFFSSVLVATDNFDSGIGCTVGANPAMSNCDGWFWNSSCNVPFGQIKNDLSASSPNSLYFNGWGGSGCFLRQPYDTPVFPDQGHITWQVYPKYTGSTWHQSLSVVEEYDPSSVYRINIDGKNVVRLQAIRDNGAYYDVNLIVGVLNDSSWNTISFYWDRSGGAIRADLNGLTGSWQNVLYPMPALNSVRIQNSGNQYLQDPILHFDDIQYFEDSALTVSLSNLGQFQADGITAIPEGGDTFGNTVVFQGTLGTIDNPENNPTRLQVEVQPVGAPFTGIPTATSIFSSTWGVVSVSVSNLSNGSYHWQARAVDSQGNA